MELFILLAALVAFAAFGTSISKPMHQSVMVSSRILLLVVCATLAQALFVSTRANDTAGQAIILALVIGWLATLQTGRTIRPGLDPSKGWLEAATPERSDLIIAGAASLVLLTILALQKGSQALGIAANRGDFASLITFAICLGCWVVIVGAATLPWRMHRKWSVPLLLLTIIVFALYLPATWLLTDGDAAGSTTVIGRGQNYESYQGNRAEIDPFHHATSSTGSIISRTSFAASASIIATNLLAIFGTLVMALRYVAAHYIRFTPDDDTAPLPGERAA